MDKEKLKEFHKILENSAISDVDKTSIRFLLTYFTNRHPKALASRSYLFGGPAGIGKTFLAEMLIEALDIPVVYLGCATFKFRNQKKCRSPAEILAHIRNNKKQLIFLDDFNYFMNEEDYDHSSEDKKQFMAILELVKRNPNKLLLVTVNHFRSFEETMIDRIEVKIDFDLPTDKTKRAFLASGFRQYLKDNVLGYLSCNSIGYNFRDLPELLKLSYRIGKNKVSLDSIKEAMKVYKPTQMYGFEVHNSLNARLNQIIGNSETVRELSKVKAFCRNNTMAEKFGIERANLLLFHGPPGTGKSLAARCLAGELGYALLVINATNLFERGPPAYALQRIFALAKRYGNCIIFVDEADKLIGNSRWGEDNMMIGELNRHLDGSDRKTIKSIIIFAMNEVSRFGDGLLDRFVSLKFELPNYEDRMVFCKKRSEDIRKGFNQSVDYAAIARMTNEMSYRGMQKVWNEVIFSIMDKGQFERDDLLRILKDIRKDHFDNSIVG